MLHTSCSCYCFIQLGTVFVHGVVLSTVFSSVLSFFLLFDLHALKARWVCLYQAYKYNYGFHAAQMEGDDKVRPVISVGEHERHQLQG